MREINSRGGKAARRLLHGEREERRGEERRNKCIPVGELNRGLSKLRETKSLIFPFERER